MKLLLTILFTAVTLQAQPYFRDVVFLGHSSGARLYDYETYMDVDSGDITSIPLETVARNDVEGFTGSDTLKVTYRWIPLSIGTDWYNWLEAWRLTISDGTNIYAIIDTFEVIALKGGIQACTMSGWGDYADTSGAGVTNKTVLNYKWIWREMVKLMEARPTKFFVLCTMSAGGDANINATQANLSHAFSTWAKDTLAAGLDPVIGSFPTNIYVFDYFHHLDDAEHYLQDGYESGGTDDHPNATACNIIAPLFVDEVFDASLAYEASLSGSESGAGRWFVKKDASGDNTGRSWKHAWNYFDSSSSQGNGGINWAIIQAGDTIFVSGGEVADTFYASSALGIGWTRESPGVCGEITFAGGDPVVVRAANQAGHDGTVYLTKTGTTGYNIARFFNVSNVSIEGINFIDERDASCIRSLPSALVHVGDGDNGFCDSLIVFKNCTFKSSFVGSLYLATTKPTFESCEFIVDTNKHSYEQDIMGASTGGGGATFNNCIFKNHNYWDYQGGTADASVIVTDSSLTDTRLNMEVGWYNDLHAIVGTGGLGMYIKSNTANTFFGEKINGSAWFTYPNYTYAGTTPGGGGEWGTDAPHKDMLQFGEHGDSTYSKMVNKISNSLIIHDQQSEDWTAMIYCAYPTTDVDWYIYNSIIVSADTSTNSSSPSGIQLTTNPAWSPIQSVHILNNTIILENDPSGSGWMINISGNNRIDSLIIKNNLIVSLSPADITLAVPIIAPPEFSEYFRDIDYNAYFVGGGFDSTAIFTPGEGFGNYTFNDWIGDGWDANSITGDADDVTFTNLYGLTKASYYTSVGRGLGVDLSAEYPFLQYDALGNPRTGAWDMGALQFGSSALIQILIGN